MAGAASASEVAKAEVKKWSCVATWSWDLQVDTCAICKSSISDLCIECVNVSESPDARADQCQVGWGVCNHAFHQHCIARWLKTRQVCPICDREWELHNVTSNA